jgi:hypothetical protein
MFRGVKWPWRETDHSPPPSDKVKNAFSYISPSPIRLRGVVLSLRQRLESNQESSEYRGHPDDPVI